MLDHGSPRVHFINMAPLKRTHKPDQALSRPIVEETSNETQQLHRTVGLGHVVIAACRSRFFLITLHRKRAYCNDRYRLESGIELYSPGGLVAVDYRHLDIHEDEVGAIGLGLGDPCLAISGLDDGVTGPAEEVAEHATQVFLVLDHKDALAHGVFFRNSARVGSSIRKVEPLPGVDITQIRPPCISTICLAMARPRPVPPLALVRELSTWWNCSKIRSCWSSGIPGPVSVTKRPFRAPAAMLTSPASVNLMALPTRFSRTCVRRCSSPRPTGSDLSTDVVSVSFLFWASDSVAARTVSTMLSMAYSVMFRVNWPDSILAMSSTVLMRPSKCLPLERMRVRASRDFGPCGS